jgi:holliday junction DNA helicase RuvA
MIAKLTGIVDSTGEGWAVVDVGGVGYLVFCSGRTLARVSAGAPVRLWVETLMREGAIHLYGFADATEREWFRLLNTVQAVGAKAALAVLSVLAPEELSLAIAAGNRAAITMAPGVGPRLAGRIISELKEKALALPGAPAAPASAGTTGGVAASAAGDAVAALVQLGFRPSQAIAAVTEAAARLGADATLETLIRDGLAVLAPKEQAP